MTKSPNAGRAKIKSFRDLEIWQRSIELVEELYQITKTFPKEELYGLTSQIRWAGVSIPSNIAEGFARLHKREFQQFLYVSLGSSAELSTQIEIACRLGYLKEEKSDVFLDEIEQISRMTMTLIKKLNAINLIS